MSGPAALDLLFEPDDEGTVQLVQQGQQPPPRRQPGPTVVPIPGAPQPQQRPRAAPQPKTKAMDLLFDDEPQQQPAPAAAPQQPSQSPGMWKRFTGYFTGQQDPAYSNVPGFNEQDLYSASGEAGGRGLVAAKTLAGNDDAYAGMIKSQLGPAFTRFEQDKHGQKVVVFKDNAGAEVKRYVNAPGLDWQDVDRGLHGALPYMAAATGVGAALGGAGLGLNVLGQGAAAAATRMGADQTANLLYQSNEPVDYGAVAITGAAGAAGPLISRGIGALTRNFSTIPGIVDRNGNLTAEGAEIARKAGLDLDGLVGEAAKKFAETYAKTRSTTEAGVRGSTTEFGIPVSRGQLTKDPETLRLEEAYRRTINGPQARDVMSGFDDAQRLAVQDAAIGINRGQPQPRVQSFAEQLAPNRGVMDINKQTLGPSVREGLQEAETAAKSHLNQMWDDVPKIGASQTALEKLPASIQQSLSKMDMEVDDALMPAAKRMGETIRDYMGGVSNKTAVPEVFGSRNSPTVDQMRRRLLSQYNAAAPGTADQRAAKAIYDGFDDWLLKAADDMVTSTADDAVQAAAKLRAARDATREIKQAFEPKFQGKATPASNIIQKIMHDEKGASAEGVIDTLFGAMAKTGAPKDGTVEALKHIKQALHNPQWGGPHSDTWNDIRLAYWSRLVIDKQGNFVTPGVGLNNIQNALTSQGSAINVLFTPQERQWMVRYAKALRDITWKDPNPSGTGYAVQAATREFMTKVMQAIGWQSNGPIGLMFGTAMTPLRNAAAGVAARANVAQRAPQIVDPKLTPYGSALVQGGLRTDLGGQSYD